MNFEPIGVVRSPFLDKLSAPRQPAAAEGVAGTIELFQGQDFEHALSDLEGWEFIWVIFVFDRNQGWRPKVLPPRSSGKRRGVFATRSPHRPNPIGLSVLRLVRVDGLTLHVANLDILDGSPVLDIKPYVPYTDALPTARTGWLEDAQSPPASASMSPQERPEAQGNPRDPVETYEVLFGEEARRQFDWVLAAGGPADLEKAITQVLALGPQPHPYRRIRADGDGYRLAWKDWRVSFRLEGRRVHIRNLGTGYKPRELAEGRAPDLHIAFEAKFGSGTSDLR